ncbi:MAG: hypothetical protein QF907_08910 [Nitrospinota bacterium]|jgi:hypothetical protein|nr:hypothetical protein [Nitrospinota bacterium]MDP7351075.1 hypothetical protein [Nitrospinota bacterium]MDP7580104.1 hypothetical protein [Nitrospinota bacterium]|tara:strand:- start:507 stop:740 length:234 start_codon:yes stop_codon:yes gene_type:complete
MKKASILSPYFSGVVGFLDYFCGNSSGFDQETKLDFKQLMQIWTLYEKKFKTKKLHFSHWNFPVFVRQTTLVDASPG